MSHPISRAARRVALVSAATAAVAAPAAATASGPPLHHAMGCYSYAFGALQFSQAIELLSTSKYGLAPDIHKHHLYGRQATGRYSRKGNTLTFKTGSWARLHLTGVWTPQHKQGSLTVGAGIALYKPHHVYSGVKCYPM